MASRLQAGRPRNRSSTPDRKFFSLHKVQTVSGSLIQGDPWARSPGIKLQRRETDHLSLSSAEVKNSGAIPPFPPRSS